MMATLGSRVCACTTAFLAMLAFSSGECTTLVPGDGASPAAPTLSECVVKMPAVPLDALGPSAVSSGIDYGNITAMALDGQYDRGLTVPRQQIAQAFYAQHPDQYDFLIVFTTFEFPSGIATAFYNPVRNDVAGIGQDIFDFSANYSSKRLQGYIDMAALSRQSYVPSDPRYEFALGTLAHEIMHRWGAYVHYRDAGGNDSTALLGQESAHWNYFLDSDASVMYGAQWQLQADSKFHAVDVRHRYGPLDMYLAGFAAPSEVAPFALIRNGDGSATDFPSLGANSGGQAETITIDQVTAASGARNPSAANAPRSFNAAMILLTRPGETLSPNTLYQLERFRVRFEQEFVQMTSGRAVIRVFTQSSPGTTGLPQILSGSPPGHGAPQAALSWLESKQQADGHWADRPATALRDTVAATQALSELDAGFSGLAAARAWIAAQNPANLDQRAWQQLGTNSADGASLLAATQDTSGGFALKSGWNASTFDTALVAVALAQRDPSAPGVHAALEWLAEHQNPDGSFGTGARGRGRVLATLRASSALGASGDALFDSNRIAAATWLATQQAQDGGIGGGSNASLADTIETFALGARVKAPIPTIAGARTFVAAAEGNAGDWGGSVYLTATAALAAAHDQRGNLALSGAPSVVPSQPHDGETANLRANVTNAGNVAVPATVARWFDGDPAQGAAQIGGDLAVPPLAPGDSAPLAQDWDTSGKAGSHTLTLVLDATALVTESSEDDNTIPLTVSVGAPSPLPTLVVNAKEFALTPSAFSTLPSPIHVSGVVHDIGLTGVSGAVVRLYALPDLTHALAQTAVDVPGRGATPIGLDFTVTAPTALRLLVRVDPDNAIAEGSETDHDVNLVLPFGQSLDLAVTASDLALVETSPTVGQNVDFDVTVRNLGTIDAPSAQVHAEVVQGGSSTVIFDNVLQLNAGQSVTRRLTWRASATGSAELRVTVDPANQIPETREDNNSATLDFTVAALTSADLTFVPDSLAFVPTPGLQGQPLVASLSVRNLSSVATGPFRVSLYAADPRSGAPALGGANVSGMSGSSDQTVTINVPDLDLAGDQTLFAWIDSANQVDETDETNNVIVAPLRVTTLPDVAVSAADIALDPALPVPGQAVHAQVTVRNLGGQDATGVVVRLLEGDAAGTPVGTDQTIATLPAGDSVVLSWDWTLGLVPDSRLVTASADPDHTVREGNENNNIASLPFDVQDGSFFASQRYISPNGDGVQDDTAIVFVLPLAGAAEIDVLNGAQYPVRHFTNVSLNAALRGQVIWDGRDDLGRIVPDGDYHVVAIDANQQRHAGPLVTVDNNSSSLFEAVHSPYGVLSGLPAIDERQGPSIPPITSPVRDQMFGFWSPSPDAAYGLNRTDTTFLDPIPVISGAWLKAFGIAKSQNLGFMNYAFSADGRQLAVALFGGGHYWIVTTSVEQTDAVTPLAEIDTLSGVPALGFFDADTIVVGPDRSGEFFTVATHGGTVTPLRNVSDVPFSIGDTQVLPNGVLLTGNEGLQAFASRDAAQPTLMFSSLTPLAADGSDYAYSGSVSPQQAVLAIYERNGAHEKVDLVDLATGTRRNLFDADTRNTITAISRTQASVRRYSLGWLEREDQLVVQDAQTRSAYLFAENGTQLARYDVPPLSRIGNYQYVGAQGAGESVDAQVLASVPDDQPLAQCLYSVDFAANGFERRHYDPSLARLLLAFGETIVHEEQYEGLETVRDPGIQDYYGIGADGSATVLQLGTLTPLLAAADLAQHPLRQLCAGAPPPDYPMLVLADGARLRADGRVQTLSRGLIPRAWPEQNKSLGKLWPDETRAKYGPGVFSSLLNLTATLRARTFGRGIELSGVATDRNFAYYQLDWAPLENPTAWQVLTPASSDQVFVDEFLTWVPPQPGTFVFRLTVVDKAGNRTTATATGSSFDSSAIDSFAPAPRYFSPNGDGVQDLLKIKFNVRRAVTLDLAISDANGQVVRTQSVTYDSSQLGPQEIDWDGRSDGGALLPDGRYRVDLDGFAAWVTLDSTPPETQATLSPAYKVLNTQCSPAQLQNHGCTWPAVATDPAVRFALREPNLVTAVIESATSGSDAWSIIADVSSLGGAGPNDDLSDPQVQIETPLSFAEYANHRFRLRVVDKAGNSTTRVLGDAPEQLIASDMLAVNHTSHLSFVETLAYQPPPLTQPFVLTGVPAPFEVFVERDSDTRLRVLDGSGLLARVALELAPAKVSPVQWNEVGNFALADVACPSALPGVCVPSRSSPELQVPLPVSTLPLGSTWLARLRGVHADGTTVYSNQALFVVGGLSPPQCLQANVTTAEIYSAEFYEGPLASATLHYGDRAVLFNHIEDGLVTFLAPADGQVAYVTAVDQQGYSHVSDSAQIQCGGDGSGSIGLTPAIDIQPVPVIADHCDGRPSDLLGINLGPHKQNGPGPYPATQLNTALPAHFRLTFTDGITNLPVVLYDQDVHDGDWNITPPKFTFSTANWPEGTYQGKLEATSLFGGQTASVTFDLPVVKTPPTVSLSNPASGQRVCAQAGGTSLPVSGSVDSADTFGYRAMLGAGARPLGYPYCRASGDYVPLGPVQHGSCHDYSEIVNFDGRPVNGNLENVTGDLAAINGLATARLKAVNWSGGTVCSDNTFFLDSDVEFSQRSPPRSAIRVTGDGTPIVGVAPNGSIAYRNAAFFLQAGEPVQIAQTISSAHFTSFGDFVKDNPVLATIAEIDSVQGQFDLGWDGTLNGSTAPDGLYAITITATDGCTFTKSITYGALVDNTPPVVAFSAPALGATTSAPVVSISGSVADAVALAHWSLDYALAASPDLWTNLADGTQPQVPADVLEDWSRGSLTGAVQLRLSATDLMGNSAQTFLTLTLLDPAKIIADAQLQPGLFSPNGDGKFDRTRLQLTLLRNANLDIRANNASVYSGPAPAGITAFTWDGTDGAGHVLGDGMYSVTIAATDPSGVALPENADLTAAIDNTPPNLQVLQPAGGFAPATGSVRFHVDDPHLTGYEASLTRSSDGAVVATQSGTQNGDITLIALNGLPEAAYALHIAAHDGAGNDTVRDVAFTLDSTPPTVALTAPADGALVAAAASSSIAGSVNDANVASWTLSVAPDTLDTWTDLAHGTANIAQGEILAWTPHLADGHYRLRLRGMDQAGNTTDVVHAIEVDGTAPLAHIAAPANNAPIRAALEIDGTASDAHLASYRLSVATPAQATGGQWADVFVGTSSITNDKLAALTLALPDDTYVLRLLVTDKVGLTATDQVTVRLDTQPPPVPLGLIGHVQNNRDAVLDWNAVGASDLAGYYVYRGGARITPTPLAAIHYVDANAPEGRLGYDVTAVDLAGNESAPSNVVTLLIDHTPPAVALSHPVAGERVRGLYDIVGTAYSHDDFKQWRLTLQPLVPAGAAQLLASGTLAVQGQRLASWNTLPPQFHDEDSVRVHLEAEDTSGNIAAVDVDVVVDNGPPAAPTGLTAVLSGSDVQTHWNPNVESDLLGYLLYRDNVLIGAVGNSLPADLRPYALADNNYLDAAVPDGTHTYVVYAIDKAGNVSPPSAPATLAPIDGHAPSMTIEQPANDTRFDTNITVLATTKDSDIAQVQFAWRTYGSSSWTNLGTALTSAPYRVIWTPPQGTPYDTYEIRAVATDLGGRSDPAPPQVRVIYADLTPPAAPKNVIAHANGGSVHVSWDASTASDLAGYRVYRGYLLNGTLLTAPSYDDVGLSDDLYNYSVTAVDKYGNESDMSSLATAHVFSIALDTPYSPVSDASAPLSGRSVRAGTISVHDDGDAGGSDNAAGPTAADGSIAIAAQALAVGGNHLTLRVTDGDGDVSRSADVWIDRGNVPAAPTGVSAGVTDHTVSLSWNANSETDLLGYRVLRKGHGVPLDAPLGEVPNVTLQTNPNGWDPNRLVDGDPQTFVDGFLAPFDASATNTIQFDWAQPRIVSSLELDWVSPDLALGNFDVQAWSGHAWIGVAQVRGDAQASNGVTLAKAYRTTRLRVVLYGPVGAYAYFQLGEVRIVERPLLSTTSLSETVIDGTYPYRVTALSAFAFESVPSSEADAVVGNPQGTSAVVLSGSLSGNEATLNWTASDSPAVVGYRLERDGHAVANVGASDARTFTDLGLTNGTHAYVVYGVDAAGNSMPPSNTLSFTVSGVGPGVPVGLTVTAPPDGLTLDSAWQPGGGSPVSYYILRRAMAANGPFQKIVEPTDPHFLDYDVLVGTTYWYTVEAVDAQGFASGQTAPVSGTPHDLLPPVAPLLTYPTVASDALVLHADNTLVCGASEDLANISLTRDGTPIAAGDVFSDFDSAYLTVPNSSALLPAPDGRHFASMDYRNLIEVERIGTPPLVVYKSDRAVRLAQWAAHGLTLYYVDQNTDDLYRWEIGQPPQYVATPFLAITALAVSADESTLLIAGDYSTNGNAPVSGIWLWSRGAAAPRRIGSLDPGMLPGAQPLSFAPDGLHALVLTLDGSAQVVDVAAGAIALVLPVDAAALPAFSPDGKRLAYARVSGPNLDDIVLYTLATQAETVLGSLSDPRAFAWSPDNRSVALSTTLELATWSLDDGFLQWTAPANLPHLGWTAAGRLFASDDSGDAEYVDFDGWFCIDAVPLASGPNRFVAIATDKAGHRSVPSATIEVDTPTDNLPDLALSPGDILFLPPSGNVGQSYSALVSLHNLGSASVAQPSIDAVLIAPDGTQRLLAPTAAPGALAAGGGVESITFALGTLTQAGSYALRVSADPEQGLRESNENNNSATALLTLSTNGAPVLELNLDGSVYAPDAIVGGDVAVTNPGNAFDGSVHLSVLDAGNAKVADLGQLGIAALGYGQRFSAPLSWNSHGVFAGNYHVHAELLGSGGNSIATRDAPFTLAIARHVQLTLLPAPALQTLGAPVALHSALDFSDGNALLSGATLQLAAIDPNGNTVWSTQQALGTLVPGYQLGRDDNWSTGALAAGVYTLRLSLISPDLNQSTDASVTLVSGAPTVALAGSLSFDPGTTVIAGETTQLHYTVDNVGGAALSGVQSRVRIVTDPHQTPVTEQDDAFDLGAGGNHGGSMALTAPPLALLGYAAILEARLPGDAAGQWRRLAQQGFSVVDLLPPQITVLTPTSNDLQPAVVPFHANIVDLHSAVASAQVRVDGGTWQAISASADGTYARGLSGLADGPHTLTVRATDTWNNPAQTADRTFTVDATPPQIDIAGVHELDLLNHPVAPTVTITDAHLDTAHVDVRLNGAPYVSGTSIDQDGSYVLSAHAADLAGNQTLVSVHFTIDRTPPTVAITAPLDGATVSQGPIHVDVLTEAAAQVTLASGNFQATATADAQGHAGFDNVPLALGANALSASALDAAGNSGGPTTITVTYQPGTTAPLTGSLQPATSQLPFSTPLGVTVLALNPNATALPAQTLRVRVLDASQNALATQNLSHDFGANESWSTGLTFDSSGWPLGTITLTLELQQGAAWSVLDTKPIGVVDRTPPAVALTAPAEGAVLHGPVVLQGTASDTLSGIVGVEGRVDAGDWSPLSVAGAGYASGAIALADGDHTADLRAFDGAGNTGSAGPVHFAIDSVPPLIAIANVADGDLLNHAVTPGVTITDEHPGTSSVQLNGQAWTSGSTIAQSGSYRIDVDATDAAGNHSAASVSFTLDLDPPQVTFDSPLDGAVLATATVDVSGHTEGLAKLHFVAGSFSVDTTADASGAFSVASVPLLAGGNTFTAHATDKAGNLGPDATITVTYRTAGIAGELGAMAAQVAVGLPLDVPYVLHNTGNSALNALPLRIELHPATGGAALASDDFTADLAAGADVSGTRELATRLLPAGDYTALLLAQPPAGPAGTWITLDSATTSLFVDNCRRGIDDRIFAGDFETGAAVTGDDIFCNGFETLLASQKRYGAQGRALRALWRGATELAPAMRAVGTALQQLNLGTHSRWTALRFVVPDVTDASPWTQPWLRMPSPPPSTDWPAPPAWSQRP